MRNHTCIRPLRRVAATLAFVSAAVLALAGCGAAGERGRGSGDPAHAGSGSTAAEQLTPVSFALDWAPNTNHIGVYVADALGYYADAGIDVEILPYGSTPAAQLVAAGAADFGIGGQAGVQSGRTSGLDIVSVYCITQQDTGRLVFLGDRDDLSRPADLDGLVFGGFGSPMLTALAATTIRGDGGKGEFEEVSLDSGSYEALSQGRIDFTLSVSTWQDIQMQLDGHPFKAFRYQDFGVPEQQSTGIISSDAYLDENADAARAFVSATALGYKFAAEHPDEAADLLIEANPDTLGSAEELVRESAKVMASDGYLVSPDRPIGVAAPDAWNEFGDFLLENGFLTDASGTTVTNSPDWSTYYTNEYLQ